MLPIRLKDKILRRENNPVYIGVKLDRQLTISRTKLVLNDWKYVKSLQVSLGELTKIQVRQL